MAQRPAVVLDKVSRCFGEVWALHDVSAVIYPGRLTGLVGPDGAGKTTLMRLMTGLLAPASGHINIVGLDTVQDADKIAFNVGYMPQRFGLYEDLSVLENMKLYARLRGLNAQESQQTFNKLLAFTRLEPFSQRLAGQLSGGMKQKLGLACAMMAAPDVLLLDEPGVGVDPLSRQDLWQMVAKLTGDGVAVVWATAYLDEAEKCDSVLLLNEGKLVFDGRPSDLTARLQGRSFGLNGFNENRRSLLSRALNLDSVCDGTIQGASLRLVLRHGHDAREIEALAADTGGAIRPLVPRFEDAFIDLLGGGPKGTSALAAKMSSFPNLPTAAVECIHLTKKFGDFIATYDSSFQVKQGEIFGLLGPNGAGKSTTFKMLCGLLRPSSGQAHVAGLDLRHATKKAKLQLGYMAQKFSLYGLLNVEQNLNLFAGMYGLSGCTKQQSIEEMIQIFQLTPYLRHSPDELPLGFKQRLALACALMHRPPVLFLDEPTSGVDPITRREFWIHINGMVQKGMTVMVTTHFMDEAEYCDRVALMYQGRLIALDTPDRLKEKVRTSAGEEPTMEQAFIRLIDAADCANSAERNRCTEAV
ncbi:ATP-binding cassette domain-containing protein [Snodgrassella alvi]|uniref:ATP-binding cassette domain-containing protein n=1 Tax=Snodgrassella alvi TaxID=1196083 RepID=UPI000C1F7354|nr:ATP-binding cassette domain-containing protein [Snodgrassella alvi]PIT42831.1 multidrug ABC transporter ATP-binding protein [Snodgrassella alvi]